MGTGVESLAETSNLCKGDGVGWWTGEIVSCTEYIWFEWKLKSNGCMGELNVFHWGVPPSTGIDNGDHDAGTSS